MKDIPIPHFLTVIQITAISQRNGRNSKKQNRCFLFRDHKRLKQHRHDYQYQPVCPCLWFIEQCKTAYLNLISRNQGAHVKNSKHWLSFYSTNLKFCVTVKVNLSFKPVLTLVCSDWQFLDCKTNNGSLVNVKGTDVRTFHVNIQIHLKSENKTENKTLAWLMEVDCVTVMTT